MSTIPSPLDSIVEARTPLPSLPLELLSYIVQLAAEDYTCTFDSAPPTSSISAKVLASLSLVSRSFRQLAQPLLFNEVTISSRVDLERWFGAVGDFDLVWPLSVGRLVRTLRIGKLDSTMSLAAMLWQGPLELTTADGYRLEELLKVCSKLSVLKLASVEQIDLESLKFAPDLQSLYVWSCDLRLYDMPPPRSAHLPAADSDHEASVPASPAANATPTIGWNPYIPQLKHLYLTDISLSLSIIDSLLTSSALPALTTLSFALNDFRDPTANEWRLNSKSMPVMTQVHSLSTSDNIDPSFAEASNLAFLDCWHLALTAETIRHLPPSIRFLRLNPIESLRLLKVDLFTEAWVKYESSVLRLLEEVWVPANYEEDATYDGLRAMCKRRGVRLVYETRTQWDENSKMDEESAYDGPFWVLARRVERLLDEERRKGMSV